MEAKKSPTPDAFTMIGSSPIDLSDVYRSSYKIDDFVTGVNPPGSKSSILPRRKKRGPVDIELDKDELESLLLMIIIKNDSPFLLVESESFRDFAHLLRDDAPTINRATTRRRLDAVHEKRFRKPKEKVDHNTGKLSIIIDEWRSGKSFDFLGITSYFYNNKFELENYTVGFEEVNGNIHTLTR